ncbi:flagellar hook-length control protein FliK [Stutzerimonas frequens]|uniref:flagellar hook-length control protein FliK n=1 Tax=Stutzerimonas frequens TaxID=2968969 RepID=UPI003F52BC12
MIQLPAQRIAGDAAGGSELTGALPRPASMSARGAVPPGAAAPIASGFRERLLRAASADPEQTLQQTAPPPEPLPSPVAPPAGSEAERTDSEPLEETAAEQWLQGMLGQQQVVVQAREAGTAQPLAWPLPAEQVAAAATEQAVAQVEGFVERQQHGQPLPWPVVTVGERQGAASAERQPAPVLRPGLETAAAWTAPTASASLLDAQLPTEQLAPLEPAAPGEVGEAPLLTGERPASPSLQGAERLLRLQAPEAKWGEQMLHALREHVEVQLQQRQQSASIRLDPPELGSLEIHLSHESGRLTVQLSAAHADVARLLQQTSDRLRQELVAQHFVQVNVQVGADSGRDRQGQPRQSRDEEQVLAAAATALPERSGRSAGLANDVLVTV